MFLLNFIGLQRAKYFLSLQNRLNITKTIRKFSVDSNLRSTGSEFHSGPLSNLIKHGDEVDEEANEGSAVLNARNFDRYANQ